MLLSTLQLLSALSLARAHQEVFNPEWLNRQSALGFDKVSDDSAPAHACGGVCLLTPEQMEGPFYLPYALDRANVTEGRPGIPVELTLTVYDVSASTSKECKPLKDAWVDIWAADYEGVYSGYGAEAEEGHPKRNWNEVLPIKNWVPRQPLPGPPGRGPAPDGPPGHAPPTNDRTFLRGVQKTDTNGKVTFHTLYPGWYPGRTTHIHLKVHAPEWEGTNTNTTHAHTTQLYFEEQLNELVSTLQPYRDNTVRRTPNDRDFLYRAIRGAGTLSTVVVGAIDDATDAAYPSGIIRAEKAVGVDKWW